MKKVCLAKGSLIILISLLLVFLVLAQEGTNGKEAQGSNINFEVGNREIQSVFSDLKSYVQDFLGILFGKEAWATKSLFGILLFLIIYTIVPYLVGENKVMGFFISLVITAIVLIAIPDVFYDSILAQYGIMGTTILSVIPFVIILVLSVLVRSALIARVIWFFYIVYYFAFYIYLIFQTSDVEGKWIWLNPDLIPYVAAIIAGFLCFLFIKKLRDIWMKGKLDALKETGSNLAKKIGLLHELQENELEEAYGGSKL